MMDISCQDCKETYEAERFGLRCPYCFCGHEAVSIYPLASVDAIVTSILALDAQRPGVAAEVAARLTQAAAAGAEGPGRIIGWDVSEDRQHDVLEAYLRLYPGDILDTESAIEKIRKGRQLLSDLAVGCYTVLASSTSKGGPTTRAEAERLAKQWHVAGVANVLVEGYNPVNS